jgi:transcription antitermination factor NusG
MNECTNRKTAAWPNLPLPVGGDEPGMASAPDRAGGRTSQWFALHVRSRHEKVVEAGLVGKGVPVLSTLCRTRRRRADRTVEIETPLFPGYVFCHFDAQQRLPILTTIGVAKIVGIGNVPSPVDDNEINSIQRLMASGRILQPWPFTRIGQRVRIQAGALRGLEGILVQVKNEHRLVASVEPLQRSIAIEIDSDMVRPI